MKTDKITVSGLFETGRRYLVPIFQRGYVWTKEGQWEPLWEDIAGQARLVHLRESASRNGLRRHFLGAIVLSQVPTVIRHVPESEVIDGQQRLLTLQVFLAALRDAVERLRDDFLNGTLKKLTSNPPEFVGTDERFKVWPTNACQAELRDVMDSGSPEALAAKYPQRLHYHKLKPDRPPLVEAYLYFSSRIAEFVNSANEEGDTSESQLTNQDLVKERAYILFEAVTRYVQLVEIELDSEDDPQVIFETLNARGVPLEPSDLIRNFVFLHAIRQGKNVNSLYSHWWREYDEGNWSGDKFWKEKERQGRLLRSRLDLFFFHYLTCRIGRDIGMGHLYQEFKDWWDSAKNLSVEAELEMAKRSSEIFRGLLDPDNSGKLGAFARRLRILDTTTLYPFLLWLFEHAAAADDMDGILADLESYIVRRAICRLTPKSYNRTFLTLLTKLAKEDAPSRTSVRRELLSLQGESAVWPNDESFRQHLVYDPLYTSLGPKRVRMVLTALELASHTPFHESIPLPINNSLTVEHIMPQSAKPDEWPYPDSSAAHAQSQLALRQTLIHSLGNLTLLTQPLNSSVSNGPFSSKRPEVTKSLLTLNSYFQSFSDSAEWNEDTILKRGKDLAEITLKVWQYPS